MFLFCTFPIDKAHDLHMSSRPAAQDDSTESPCQRRRDKEERDNEAKTIIPTHECHNPYVSCLGNPMNPLPSMLLLPVLVDPPQHLQPPAYCDAHYSARPRATALPAGPVSPPPFRPAHQPAHRNPSCRALPLAPPRSSAARPPASHGISHPLYASKFVRPTRSLA